MSYQCVGGCIIGTDETGGILDNEGDVGEFYRIDDEERNTVIAHVDCLPDGGLSQEDGDGGSWQMA